jgi:hypothetical protein
VIGLIAALYALVSILQNALPLIDVTLPRIIPRLPLPWALVIFLTVAIVVVIEGGYQRAITERIKIKEAIAAAKETADVGRPKLSLKFPYANGKIAPAMIPQMWLVNFGDRVATDIRIDPISNGPYLATFAQIQNIGGQPSGLNGVNLIPAVTKDGEMHHVFSRNGQYFYDLLQYGTTSISDDLWLPVTIKFMDGGIERTNTLKIHCNRPSMFVNVGDQVF